MVPLCAGSIGLPTHALILVVLWSLVDFQDLSGIDFGLSGLIGREEME